ncbi:MAG: MoaD/ThiS family protein, partial [Candidatus Omnitrophica bacterium]|nr:MoaD/ThiS family protein [Candidatus Omnitrophota bacterium]
IVPAMAGGSQQPGENADARRLQELTDLVGPEIAQAIMADYQRLSDPAAIESANKQRLLEDAIMMVQSVQLVLNTERASKDLLEVLHTLVTAADVIQLLLGRSTREGQIRQDAFNLLVSEIEFTTKALNDQLQAPEVDFRPRVIHSYEELFEAMTQRQQLIPTTADPELQRLNDVLQGFKGYRGQAVFYLARVLQQAVDQGYLRFEIGGQAGRRVSLQALGRQMPAQMKQDLIAGVQYLEWERFFEAQAKLNADPESYKGDVGLVRLARELGVYPLHLHSAFIGFYESLGWLPIYLTLAEIDEAERQIASRSEGAPLKRSELEKLAADLQLSKNKQDSMIRLFEEPKRVTLHFGSILGQAAGGTRLTIPIRPGETVPTFIRRFVSQLDPVHREALRKELFRHENLRADLVVAINNEIVAPRDRPRHRLQGGEEILIALLAPSGGPGVAGHDLLPNVTLHLGATLKEAAGGTGLSVSIQPGETVQSAVERFVSTADASRREALERELLKDGVLRTDLLVVVNNEVVSPNERQLRGGDHVTLMLPIAGGDRISDEQARANAQRLQQEMQRLQEQLQAARNIGQMESIQKQMESVGDAINNATRRSSELSDEFNNDTARRLAQARHDIREQKKQTAESEEESSTDSSAVTTTVTESTATCGLIVLLALVAGIGLPLAFVFGFAGQLAGLLSFDVGLDALRSSLIPVGAIPVFSMVPVIFSHLMDVVRIVTPTLPLMDGFLQSLPS